MKKLHLLVLIIICIGLLMVSCTKTDSAPTSLASVRIEGIPGPEDIVIEAWTGKPRLLVSACVRRVWLPDQPTNGIYQIDPDTGKTALLPREGEPRDYEIHPHGIRVIKADTGDVLLYMISHSMYNETRRDHILVYRVLHDRLVFKEELHDESAFSPNALTVFSDGSFYVANDNGGKWVRDIILKAKKATVVYYDGKGTWKTVADKIGAGTGIERVGNHIYVSAYLENKIYRYTITGNGDLTDKVVAAKIPGPDNFFLTDDGQLLVAGNRGGISVFKHFKDEKNITPSNLWKLDPVTGDYEEFFIDDGSTISAASVGVMYQGSLFIGQVLNNYVLKVTL